jgi:hypothetical protein
MSNDEPEYYQGHCPIDGWTITPLQKLTFNLLPGEYPVTVCPIHLCEVYLGVISKEEYDAFWRRFSQPKDGDITFVKPGITNGKVKEK